MASEQIRQQALYAAKKAASNAWCPYSEFPVGAAVVCDDGSIFAGCNVENASSGLTICAERNAIAQAVAERKTDFQLVVVFTPTSKPTAPCGACRQVIREFTKTAPVECYCEGKEILETSIDLLLPESFGPESLTW